MIEQWIDVLGQRVGRSTHDRVVEESQDHAVIAERVAHCVERRRRGRVGVFDTRGRAGVAYLPGDRAVVISGT